MNARALGLLILRVVPSGMLLVGHGLGKAQKFGTLSKSFADPLGVGPMPSLLLTLLGEVVGPLLVIAGAFTRFAAIPPFITMAVAAFVVHAADPFGKKELALLYALPFLAVILIGPGEWSVDGKVRRKGL